MTGTFTIKRRKQDTPRAEHQSRSAILAALGIGVGRSSPHVGSKRGYAHLTDPAPEIAYARAQEWADATGRPLPPALKPLRPLTPPAPLSVHQRFAAYAGGQPSDWDHLSVARLLDAGRPAQRRRLLHKAGHNGERPAGWKSARHAEPGPRAPRSPAAKRRARKNAAQQARHQARLP